METLEARFNPRRNNFDLIRLIAALVVVFAHSYALAQKEYDPLSSFLSYGFSGTLAVWAFLIISGFLVARSRENNDLTSFVLARFLRIYPGFVLVTVVETFVIAPIFYDGKIYYYFANFAGAHLHNLLLWPQDYYIPNVFNKLPFGAMNGSLWTIPLELSFYVVLVVLIFIANFKMPYLYALVFFASLAGQVALFYLNSTYASSTLNLLNGISAFQFITYSSYFLVGVCAWKYRELIHMNLGGLVIAFSSMLAARNSYFAPLAVTFCLPYIILYIAVSGSFGTAMAQRIGDLSYGTYLFAYPITNCVVSLTKQRLPSLAVFLITCPVILSVAWLSWRFVEKPCLSMKRHRKNAIINLVHGGNFDTSKPHQKADRPPGQKIDTSP